MSSLRQECLGGCIAQTTAGPINSREGDIIAFFGIEQGAQIRGMPIRIVLGE